METVNSLIFLKNKNSFKVELYQVLNKNKLGCNLLYAAFYFLGPTV